MKIGEPHYCPIAYADEGVTYRNSPDEWLPEISGDPDALYRVKPYGDFDLVEFDVMRKFGDFRLLVRRDKTFAWQGAAPPEGCTLFDATHHETWGDRPAEIADGIVGNDMLDGDEIVIDIEALWSERHSPIYRVRCKTLSLGEAVVSREEVPGGGTVTTITHPDKKVEWSLEPVAFTELGPLPTVDIPHPPLDVAPVAGSA